MDNFNIGDTVRVIWKSSGDHFHCLLGNILNKTEKALEIEYSNPDSILGNTNIKKILKNEIVNIVKRC